MALGASSRRFGSHQVTAAIKGTAKSPPMAYPAPERNSGAAKAMERTNGLVSPGRGHAANSASPPRASKTP